MMNENPSPFQEPHCIHEAIFDLTKCKVWIKYKWIQKSPKKKCYEKSGKIKSSFIRKENKNLQYGVSRHWRKVTFSQVEVSGHGQRTSGMSKGMRYGSWNKASRNKATAIELERGKISRWRAKRSLLKDKMATLTNCSPVIMNWAEGSSRILWHCFQFLWNANMVMARYIPRCPWRS